MNPGLPIVEQLLVPGAALHPGTASHRWPKTPVPANAAADNGGRKTIPPCSPAFTPAGFPARPEPARGRTDGNARDTGGKPMEVCRKVLPHRTESAKSSMNTGVPATFRQFDGFPAESWRKSPQEHNCRRTNHQTTKL